MIEIMTIVFLSLSVVFMLLALRNMRQAARHLERINESSRGGDQR